MELKRSKKLGFGLMRLPVLNKTDVSSVDINLTSQMVDTFMENGFDYFDTAWTYHGFASETVVKEVLTKRYPREKFRLATKIHLNYFNTPTERENIFNEELKKTGVDYFDYYLLHSLEEKRFNKAEQLNCFEWLADKKEKGFVNQIGFSYHDNAELLDAILSKHPEIDFVQLQVNYLDWDSKWIQSRACYEIAKRHCKPVIVMEPIKGGTLANIPTEAEELFKRYSALDSPVSWALRFAASLDNVMMVLSGMNSMDQLEENILTMNNFHSLDSEEIELCFKVAEIIKKQIAIPCTGCGYCVNGCPKHISIPDYFSIYNEDKRECLEKGWTANAFNYQLIAERGSKASECLACGQCETVCPQHLTIIKYLKDVAEHYE